MEVEILELRKKKFTIEQIAQQLGITVGQVKYRLYKKNLFSDPSTKSDEKSVISEKQLYSDVPLPDLYYGEDQIVTVVCGPTTIYVYWELTWSLCRLVGGFLQVPFDSLNKQLRIYDVTDIWFNGNNAHWHRDIIIESIADNWFVHDLPPGRTFVFDLGIVVDQRFIPLLRSKAKATPKNTPSDSEFSRFQYEQDLGNKEKSITIFENFSAYTLY